MRHRLPPWAVLVVLAVACAAVIATVASLRLRTTSVASLIERLPPGEAAVVYVDFAALRESGLLAALAGQSVGQEPEYRSFVDETGFDYRHDLDAVLVSVQARGTFLVVRGRFDWNALAAYIGRQGGSCYNMTCRVQGSRPERKISLFPIQPNLMALAVSPDGAAVEDLKSRRPGPAMAVPPDPVWARIPVSMLQRQAGMPEGARLFTNALGGAQSILLAAGLDGGQMAVRLEVTCRSATDAAALAAQLTQATAALRDSLARRRQTPNAADFTGVLTGGAFQAQGDRVQGRWPVPREFLESLVGSPLS